MAAVGVSSPRPTPAAYGGETHRSVASPMPQPAGGLRRRVGIGSLELAGDMFEDVVVDGAFAPTAGIDEALVGLHAQSYAIEEHGWKAIDTEDCGIQIRSIVIPQITIAQLSECLRPATPCQRTPAGTGEHVSITSEAPQVVVEPVASASTDRQSDTEAAVNGVDPEAAETRTTVVLLGIAVDLDEDGMRKILDERGFAGRYNAVYVPRNAKKDANLRYGFINFLHPEGAAACIQTCSGRNLGPSEPHRVCNVKYARVQGLGFMDEKIEAASTKKRQKQQRRACPRAVGSSLPFTFQ